MYRCNNCSLQHISGPASVCNTYICFGITWIYCSTPLGWCLSVKKPFAIGVLCSSFLNHPALLQRHVITSGQVLRWYNSPLQHTSEQMSIPAWASAHITRILCSSLLDWCPCIWWHMHLYQCPNDTGDLCNILLGWCPGVIYVSWCPVAKQVLCSTLLGWSPLQYTCNMTEYFRHSWPVPGVACLNSTQAWLVCRPFSTSTGMQVFRPKYQTIATSLMLVSS